MIIQGNWYNKNALELERFKNMTVMEYKLNDFSIKIIYDNLNYKVTIQGVIVGTTEKIEVATYLFNAHLNQRGLI